jgi:hypothetical protein
MYADFEAGRDIVIIRQSFSGESYNVWNLAEAVKRTITPVSYKMTFVNDTGDRVNKIVFASTNKQSWTETESSVVIKLNGHDLIPDSRFLKFTDFAGDVVVSLCDKLQNFLTSGGYVP